MPCYSPLKAFQLVTGEVVFSERGDIKRGLTLACGQCIGCRLERSRQWAVRCMHEASMHKHNVFITLTYDQEHFPVNGSLYYPDFQKFIRRLRKKYGRCRFYMCGEYGELYKRPHFHACLFGMYFDDRKYFKELSSGFKLYTSEKLRELWPFGFSSVGDVSFESAAYVARYITKKVTGVLAVSHYERVISGSGQIVHVVPEFTRMSLKPGIGKDWIVKYGPSDVFHRDAVVVRGHESKVPRYYDKYWSEYDPDGFEAVQFDREKKAELFSNDCTEERLLVREKVARARLAFKKRILE